MNCVHFECSYANKVESCSHFVAHQPSLHFKSFLLWRLSSKQTTPKHQTWDWRLKMFLVSVFFSFSFYCRDPITEKFRFGYILPWSILIYFEHEKKIRKVDKKRNWLLWHRKLRLLVCELSESIVEDFSTFRCFNKNKRWAKVKVSESINVRGVAHDLYLDMQGFSAFSGWVEMKSSFLIHSRKRSEIARRQNHKTFELFSYFILPHFSHITSSCKGESNYWKIFKFYVVFCV